MKKRTILTVALAAFTAGSAATAAVGWRTFASATDSGDYSTYANASASVQNPNALGVRVSGNAGPYEVTWYASCEGVVRPKAGAAVLVGVPQSAKCTLSASASGGEGKIRVELLRR